MSLIPADRLMALDDLLDAEVNMALISHACAYKGFLKIELSHITYKYSDQQAFDCVEALCHRLELLGYHCYFSSYYTFFHRIHVCVSLEYFEKLYEGKGYNPRFDVSGYKYFKPFGTEIKKA